MVFRSSLWTLRLHGNIVKSRTNENVYMEVFQLHANVHEIFQITCYCKHLYEIRKLFMNITFTWKLNILKYRTNENIYMKDFKLHANVHERFQIACKCKIYMKLWSSLWYETHALIVYFKFCFSDKCKL